MCFNVFDVPSNLYSSEDERLLVFNLKKSNILIEALFAIDFCLSGTRSANKGLWVFCNETGVIMKVFSPPSSRLGLDNGTGHW